MFIGSFFAVIALSLYAIYTGAFIAVGAGIIITHNNLSAYMTNTAKREGYTNVQDMTRQMGYTLIISALYVVEFFIIRQMLGI
jgi:hypothetical protein